MKIAIFGDSFANHYGQCKVDDSWSDILKSSYDVTNFSMPGSCLYFSYDLFMKNHSKFDKIVFCITDFQRIYLGADLPLYYDENRPNRNLQLNSLDMYQTNIKNNNKILEAARLYYNYVYDSESSLVFHDLMIEKIKNVRPDGLYFYKDLWTVYYKENNFYNMENKLGKNWNTYYRDDRTCHITGTNNLNLAFHVTQWLNDDSYKITEEMMYKTPTEPIEKYFVKK